MEVLAIIGWTLAGVCALGWILTDIKLATKSRHYNQLAREIFRITGKLI